MVRFRLSDPSTKTPRVVGVGSRLSLSPDTAGASPSSTSRRQRDSGRTGKGRERLLVLSPTPQVIEVSLAPICRPS